MENLNLSENLLSSLPSSISQLKALKQVNLSKNHLTEIPKELCQLKQMNALDLSSNRITQIKDYIQELNCVELNLNENQIKTISPNLAKCPRLKVVRLQQNILDINSIPTSLLTDSQIALINYDGNLFNQKQFEKLDGYEKVFIFFFYKTSHIKLIRVKLREGNFSKFITKNEKVIKFKQIACLKY